MPRRDAVTRSCSMCICFYYSFVFETIFVTATPKNSNVNVISDNFEITSLHNLKDSRQYLTPRSKFHLENLPVYGILCVIIVFQTYLTYRHAYLYESSLPLPFLILGAPLEYYSHIYIYMLRSFLRGHVVSCFPVKILFLFFFSSIRATFPAHLTLLVVITPVIFVEGKKLRSSSLCRRLHYPDSFSSRYLSQHYSRENPRPMLM